MEGVCAADGQQAVCYSNLNQKKLTYSLSTRLFTNLEITYVDYYDNMYIMQHKTKHFKGQDQGEISNISKTIKV